MNQIIKSFLFLNLLFKGSLAFAVMGELNSTQFVPPQVCLITLKKLTIGDQFHCTGTLVQKDWVKTAGHCLVKSKVQSVHCGQESFNPIRELQYENYDHQTLEEEFYHRGMDQALIQLNTSSKELPIKMLTSKREFNALKKSNPFCMLAGFGLQKEFMTRTGVLGASELDISKLSFFKGILFYKGRYLNELMPGDSGGGLLCHDGKSWIDLGSASAHTWEHESVYAPNWPKLSWMKKYLTLPKKTETGNKPIRKSESSPKLKIGDKVYIKPFSQIQTAEGPKYNGDLDALSLTITKIEKNHAIGELEVNSSSIFYLCEDDFVCYGDTFQGSVPTHRLTHQKPRY